MELDVEDITIGHDNIAYMEHWHGNTWPYEALLDARTAATQCLKQVADLFEGEKRTKIESLADRFSQMEQALRDNWKWMPLRFWIYLQLLKSILAANMEKRDRSDISGSAVIQCFSFKKAGFFKDTLPTQRNE